MLYLIGIGIGTENDITMSAISAIKKCDVVYHESYTNKWHGNVNKLEKLTGKKIFKIERQQVESDFLVNEAKRKKIGLLISGDPLTATTHIELFIQAQKNKTRVNVIHGISIYTAVAHTGLQIYKFGRTTTIAFPEKDYMPTSPYDVIEDNFKMGLHTLVLLDTADGKNYMTVHDAINILEKMEKIKKGKIIQQKKLIACCCMGTGKQIIKYGTPYVLKNDRQLKRVPAAIIVPGNLHFKEEEALELWK